jgi:hypothetical protein
MKLQTLVHCTSRALIDWPDRVLDFGIPDGFTHPGMFVCSDERGGGPADSSSASRPLARYEELGPPDLIGDQLISSSGRTLAGPPNLAWRSTTGGQVEILVTGRLSLESDHTSSKYALPNVNEGNGPWGSVARPIRAVRELEGRDSGYSPSLLGAVDRSIVRAATVRNDRGSHDIVIGRTSPISEKH